MDPFVRPSIIKSYIKGVSFRKEFSLEVPDAGIDMIKRPFVLVLVCLGIFIFFQSLVPTVVAMERSSDLDEYTLEDQRTRKRKNYVVKMGRGTDILDNTSNIGPRYETDLLQPDANSEELSALMVDYANMMRNDVILLDNSVETRTRKRGNIKVEKHNQAIPDSPCSCESIRETKDLGENSVPRYVETRNCSNARQTVCRPPYICKETIYYITILTRRETRNQVSTEMLPDDLKYKWLTEKRPISVGCTCVSEYKY